MSAAGFTPIQLYRSTTASAVPTSGNLADGELAINTNDGKLYYKDSGGIVQLIASKAGASGDVVGPASATDNAIVRFDGTTGKLVQNSVVTIADSTGDISGVGQLNATTVDTTNIEVTNIKAKDGTAAATIADSTGVVTVTAAPVMTALTASQAVFTTAGKALTSNAITGTGSVVMSASPTLTGTISAAAATLSGNLTLSGGTANGVLYLDGSKVATSGSALTFDGTTFATTANVVQLKNIGELQWKDTTGTGQNILYMFNDNNVYLSSPVSGSSLIFRGAGYAETMRLTSTGLGIGTSSPAYKLDVITASASNFIRTGVTGSNSGAGVIFQGAISGQKNWVIANQYNVNGGLEFTQTTANGGSTIGATPSMVIDSSGNLGLGVTPSAWRTNVPFKVLQVGYTAALYGIGNIEQANLASNYYQDSSGTEKRIQAGYATKYQQASGAHTWSTAGTSTADSTITFTQAMTLTSDGNLVIGDTSGTARLEVKAAGVMGRFKTGAAADGRVEWAYNTTDIGYIGADTSTEFSVFARSGNVLKLGAGGTERARITSGGDFVVGYTAAGAYDTTSFSYSPAIKSTDTNHATGASSGDNYARFNYAGGTIGSITQNGTTGVLYNITSDYRLKTVTGPVSNAGLRIDALEPVEYTWKSDGATARGFLAHQFQEVYPNSVTGEKDAVDADGKPVYQNMQASTSEVIADLVAEIKSLRQRVAQLEGTQP